MYWHIFSKRKRRWYNLEAAELAAASKEFGYARGEKVMKEIRGGLPEKDANRGFWGVSTFFLIVLVLFGFLLCREGTGICETIIGIGAIYLILLCFFIGISRSYVMNEKGIAITFNNFKVWTKMYPWEEYDEIKIENTQWSQHSQVIFTMTFVKKKRNIYDFIFSGNVSAECTEETYALVKSWLPESVRMPKVKF